jgi:acetolactate synthase-1/2/3 large subunit
MKKKVSDLLAEFLAKKNIPHVFGIIGSGNAHIFDSIYQTEVEMICVHHEQAACMAMQTYYRTSGIVTASILTTGAGSTNGVTGVVSAWADSIPGIIISGNENSKYIVPENHLRMYGIQGYDCTFMVSRVTKYTARVMDPKMILFELEKAYHLATSGRPGPCWIDVPMNIQSSFVEEDELIYFNERTDGEIVPGQIRNNELKKIASKIAAGLKTAKRPVIWLGNGIRLAQAENLLPELLAKIKGAYLLSWAGIDMIDSDHPLVFGRAGVYGQRAANFVLQNSDFVLTIGTRLSISQVGYDISELAREAEIVVVDIDKVELDKYPERYNQTICADAGEFIQSLIEVMSSSGDVYRYEDWLCRCNSYKHQFPWVGKEHDDVGGYLNSYRFMERLNHLLKPTSIIVTDMGTALISGHQVLKIRDKQRLMTSTGLGEMGYGLPAAMGASFATDRGEVICLNCDGGMMMNLQELQTVAHHQLPIKLIIFNNDGYLMIKHTQKSIAKGRFSGVDKKSGVSCPDFSKVAKAFDIPSWQIRRYEEIDTVIQQLLNSPGPGICEVFMHPEQLLIPKLGLAIQKDGSLISPPLEDLSPFISRELLKEVMIEEIHSKSRNIDDI